MTIISCMNLLFISDFRHSGCRNDPVFVQSSWAVSESNWRIILLKDFGVMLSIGVCHSCSRSLAGNGNLAPPASLAEVSTPCPDGIRCGRCSRRSSEGNKDPSLSVRLTRCFSPNASLCTGGSRGDLPISGGLFRIQLLYSSVYRYRRHIRRPSTFSHCQRQKDTTRMTGGYLPAIPF